ncbi:SDR family NAD(P)-dependent oxidoreductase [Chromohalobacter sp. HP20-39]|uniref:SDR family NAD(P)-dependent oxidoreductase n=1 Tax=Chromohalobacter sp. HP20-39 TaxID=3079306 RepID=UPI00294AAE39|nr:SDR family NAD(P)-dependent oxidoreductase [Chromohalobacter sp. HP20-39]MDV6318000.1 SDR family NAD(P)-dependent oxidoreductase [Chromohalobacter sp. HP20-39]
MNNTSQPAILVTGGASGIGFAVARTLLARDITVFLLDLSAEKLTDACRELGLNSGDTQACDIANEASVEAAVRTAAARHTLSGVVNCAGIGMDCLTADMEVDGFRKIIDVNLVGTFIVSRTMARYWLNEGYPGRIVNISSVSGMRGNKGRSAYGAAKAGQNALTLVMANELGDAGIRVNAVAPGPIDTPLAQAMHTPEVREQWHSRVPMKRYGTPNEVASAVAFLLSDESGYINGQVLAVDGGFATAGLFK